MMYIDFPVFVDSIGKHDICAIDVRVLRFTLVAPCSLVWLLAKAGRSNYVL